MKYESGHIQRSREFHSKNDPNCIFYQYVNKDLITIFK
jgi:hypothetical protein